MPDLTDDAEEWQDELMDDEPLRLRSIRCNDTLWSAAQAAAKWRGDKNLSAVIRRMLANYVRDTEQRKRDKRKGRKR